jgi:hypothetical protein
VLALHRRNDVAGGAPLGCCSRRICADQLTYVVHPGNHSTYKICTVQEMNTVIDTVSGAANLRSRTDGFGYVDAAL